MDRVDGWAARSSIPEPEQLGNEPHDGSDQSQHPYGKQWIPPLQPRIGGHEQSHRNNYQQKGNNLNQDNVPPAKPSAGALANPVQHFVGIDNHSSKSDENDVIPMPSAASESHTRLLIPSNAPAQARRANDVRLSAKTRSRRCLQTACSAHVSWWIHDPQNPDACKPIAVIQLPECRSGYLPRQPLVTAQLSRDDRSCGATVRLDRIVRLRLIMEADHRWR